MRTYAESELQDKFDPRDFYDVVLLSGAVPLDVLKERVEEYVNKTKDKESAATGNGSGNNSGVTSDFIETMTFANWCKCCVVPGACQV
jgi:hypothetical protein